MNPGFTSTGGLRQHDQPSIAETKGVLLHRGYPDDQACQPESTTLEVCYLLLYGEFPSRRSLRVRGSGHRVNHTHDPRANDPLLSRLPP